MERKCVICKKPIEGKSNKKTCGSGCRKKLMSINRNRKQNDIICNLFG